VVVVLSGSGNAASAGTAVLPVARRLPGHGDAASDGSGVIGTGAFEMAGAGYAASDGVGILLVVTLAPEIHGIFESRENEVLVSSYEA
jgi:hypothetical protein